LLTFILFFLCFLPGSAKAYVLSLGVSVVRLGLGLG